MASRKAVVVLLMVYAAAMLTSQIAAFVPTFTWTELQRMQLLRRAQMGVRMTARQLEKYQAALEGLPREAMSLDPFGKHVRVVSLWLKPGRPPCH
ncbi:promotilin [Grammomys surdaster]|uniref:promotilin n=1 Tax=Grammomys surdaster TaxID=491861 RepID=UPI0010A00433|nr:promotilin [Grammomys surdaster]